MTIRFGQSRFGTRRFSQQLPTTIEPTGIVSAEAFGTAKLNQKVYASGIASGTAVPSPRIALKIAVSGIPSQEAIGTPKVITAFIPITATLVTLNGIDSSLVEANTYTITMNGKDIWSTTLVDVPSLLGTSLVQKDAITATLV